MTLENVPSEKFDWVLNTPWVLKCFQIDLVNRISCERKVNKNVGTSKFEYSQDPLGDVLRTPWGCPESTFQGCSLNVRLGRRQDVRVRHPWGGQIGSLGGILGTLEEDVLGRPGYQYLPVGLFYIILNH